MGLFIRKNLAETSIVLFFIILAIIILFNLEEELSIETTINEDSTITMVTAIAATTTITTTTTKLIGTSFAVSLSATELEQGDTLIITAENVPEGEKITGEFNSKSFDFFPVEQEGKCIAILGVDVKKAPGEYSLSVFLSGESEFKKTITVKKKDFYITKIVITPELEEKGFTPSIISESISTKDWVIIYEVLGKYSHVAYFNQKFIYPLDEIINVGAFGNIRKDGDVTIQHLGVDLDAVDGTPVYAINDGKVALVQGLTVYGNTVIIDHGLGIYSLYLHLSEFKVSEGEMVEIGELIGFSGNTGWSVGPHLHLSIKLNGASVDPLIFIREIDKFLK